MDLYKKKSKGVLFLHYIYSNTNNIMFDKIKLLVTSMRGQ